MPKGKTYVHGMLFGLYSYGGTMGVSLASRRHPWLTRLLVGALRAESPDFPFTSIQLNYNYASRPHVDKNNLGTSYIVALGAHSGGDVWVHDAEAGEKPFTLGEDEDDVS